MGAGNRVDGTAKFIDERVRIVSDLYVLEMVGSLQWQRAKRYPGTYRVNDRGR
jgi:hypothetical protein